MSQKGWFEGRWAGALILLGLVAAWPLPLTAYEDSEEWKLGPYTFRLEVKVNNNGGYTSVQAFCHGTTPVTQKYIVDWVPPAGRFDGPHPIEFLKHAIEAEIRAKEAKCYYAHNSEPYEDVKP